MTDLSPVRKMLEEYRCGTNEERISALREIAQELALIGLSRTDFFSRAAFYGGTALRIFHGLERYSEDLDFSLANADISFSLSDYLPAVRDELASWGFEMTVEKKEKSRDAVDAMFRHAHSVKGMAASMGFEQIAVLAHRVEDLVAHARSRMWIGLVFFGPLFLGSTPFAGDTIRAIACDPLGFFSSLGNIIGFLLFGSLFGGLAYLLYFLITRYWDLKGQLDETTNQYAPADNTLKDKE